MEDTIKKCDLLHLEPFIHQVGGHSSLLCFDVATVCKPLVARELQFYQTLPEVLHEYVPSFHGIVHVHIIPEEGGYFTLGAKPPTLYRIRDYPTYRSRLRLCRTGSVEIESELEGLFDEDTDDTKCQSALTRTSRCHNPWVLKCQQEHLNRISAVLGTCNILAQKFILLENLTCHFTYPCILDLKMGTRQHGDDDPPAKKNSKLARVASTTSGTLGLRVAGMQVYQITSSRFTCRNKYYGRGLSVDGFRQALIQFLHNGSRLRRDLIPSLIRQLQTLTETIEKLDTFRFYTCSLLLIYEGLDADEIEMEENLEECNSANEVNSSTNRSNQSINRGELGRSVSADTVSLVDHQVIVQKNKERERSRSVDKHKYNVSTVRQNVCKLQKQLHDSEIKSDVRIIDFAHSTHRGFGDPVAYSGPDKGFIFGLKNLITVLQGIERNDYKCL